MKSILSSLYNLQELKNFSPKDLSTLAREIRLRLIEVVTKNGGHLSSNLGVVELTIAIHRVFESPIDKIVLDVSHQCYVHKILTQRNDEKFDKLRMTGGYSGFLNPNESKHDQFFAGHAGTSLSVALGFAKARDMDEKNHHIISIIGDGSLTCGMIYEALNNLHDGLKNFIIILNDNGFSIDKNVGALSDVHDKDFRTKKLCEVFDIDYIGPFDGHNLDELESQLTLCKFHKKPILLHVKTKKGYGYDEALNMPDVYHKVTYHNTELDKKYLPYSEYIGKLIYEAAINDKNIIGVTAAMANGTGLDMLRRAKPEQFIDVGIAEEHAVTFSAGLAKSGKLPICCIYSTFLQRAFDQIIHDVCLQNLHVIFFVKSGVSAHDGPTHHGVFDLSYLACIPNAVVCEPRNCEELSMMFNFALKHNGPIFIRHQQAYIKEDSCLSTSDIELNLNDVEIIQSGSDICFLTIGHASNIAKVLSDKLRVDNISCGIVTMRFVKPLNKKFLQELANKYKNFVTIEDNVVYGGFGSLVSQFFAENQANIRVLCVGWPDKFINHGSSYEELREICGISDLQIYSKILSFLNR